MPRAHRGEWCPALLTPLKMESVSEARVTGSTLIPEQGEDSSEGSSEESAPEWTPREPPCNVANSTVHSAGASIGTTFHDPEPQPPWVNAGERMPSAVADPGRSLRRSPRQGRPCQVPPLGAKLPLRFDMYTPRSPRLAQNSPFQQKECVNMGPAESHCSSSHSVSPSQACGSHVREVLLSNPRASPDFANARAEVAEAHTELLARAAELRRRERRLKQLERGATLNRISKRHSEADKENFRPCSIGREAPVGENGATRGHLADKRGWSPHGARKSRSCSRSVKQQASSNAEASPRQLRSPRRSPRRTRSRRCLSAGAGSGDDLGECDRRMKKEIRLERRLRRRAEESAAAVWRNALLVAAVVSLCVMSLTALSVAMAIRT